MTRRITLVLLSVVVTTLVLAGLGTLLLSSVHTRRNTVDDVRTYAAEIAANVGDLLDFEPPADSVEATRQLRIRVRLLQIVRTVVDVDDLAIVTLAPDGSVATTGPIAGDELPAPVSLADLTTLGANGTPPVAVGGSRDGTAFGVATVQGLRGRQWFVVVTRDVPVVASEGLTVFASAAGATLLIALIAAWLLGRRLARPLDDAAAAAQRIADGDLATRLPDPRHGESDELAALARSINHMAHSLERSRALEQQFLLSVSHDLRTPLTSIRGYAEAIADGTGDARASAAVIGTESRRLERLVADLLDLAKLQSTSFRLDLGRVDVAAAVVTAVEAISPSRPEVRVEAHPSTPVHAVVDRDRLAQVFANLLENAVRHAATAVRVDVTRSDDSNGHRVVVTVDDDGPGIAEEDLPHVFERLYVARRSPDRRENSSGLGLAIVRELVMAMGGSVAAGTAPAGGARFTVSLPVAVD